MEPRRSDVCLPLAVAYAAASAECPPSECDIIGLLYMLQFLIHSTFIRVYCKCYSIVVSYVMDNIIKLL